MPIHGTLKTTVLSADGAAVTGKGFFYGVVVSGAAGAVVIRDNTAASGNSFMHVQALGSYLINTPIPFNVGIHIDLTANIVTVFYTEAP